MIYFGKVLVSDGFSVYQVNSYIDDKLNLFARVNNMAGFIMGKGSDLIALLPQGEVAYLSLQRDRAHWRPSDEFPMEFFPALWEGRKQDLELTGKLFEFVRSSKHENTRSWWKRFFGLR